MAADYPILPLADEVNTWWGTASETRTGHGPGPQMPWGSINPGPTTWNEGRDLDDGYRPGAAIRGFTQLKLDAFYMVRDYGYFLVAPQVGLKTRWDVYESPASDEVSEVGYYACTLDKSGIRAEMTAAHYSAVYRFTFPKGSDANILIESTYTHDADILAKTMGASKLRQASAELSADGREITGSIKGDRHGPPPTWYFVARFDRPVARFGTWQGDTVSEGSQQIQLAPGDRGGAFAGFDTSASPTVTMSMAVSMTSVERAREHLEREAADFDFKRVQAANVAAWNTELSRIVVKGESPFRDDFRTAFYSCLYSALRMPRDRTLDHPYNDRPFYDDIMQLWDVWMTWPLLSTFYPDVARENVNSFINRQEIFVKPGSSNWVGRSRYGMARSNPENIESTEQAGNQVDNIIADAFIKGYDGIDWQAAYDLVLHNATNVRRNSYRENDQGWAAFEEEGHIVSKSVDFNMNDFMVAQMARKLGRPEDARRFLERSQRWDGLWNPNLSSDGFSGFIGGRYADGSWHDFDPASSSDGHKPSGFCEASSWTYSYYMFHDWYRLIEKLGGREQALARHQQFLSDLSRYGSRVVNQPGMYNFFFGHYLARPDLSSTGIMERISDSVSETIPTVNGNDDGGSLSAYVVLGSIGVFNITGLDTYFLTTPFFPEITAQLDEGKLRIIAHGLSKENTFIQSATLNGKPLTRAWLRYADIKDGAVLEYQMGPTPSDWGTAEEELPPDHTRELKKALAQ